MLPDLEPHRREGVLFTLGLDHYIHIPVVEGAQKGSPVAAVHGVCVRTGLLDGVLARRPPSPRHESLAAHPFLWHPSVPVTRPSHAVREGVRGWTQRGAEGASGRPTTGSN